MKKIETDFTRQLKIEIPVIVAPMFLVSNEEMLIAAAEGGAIGVVPSLNFRAPEDLRRCLRAVRAKTQKPYGVNLIVQKTNPFQEQHLKICLEEGVPFFITSLGSPKDVIEGARKIGAKVYCDVVNTAFADKVVSQGADGLIAVCTGAGGHAGSVTANVLIPELKERFKVPVIAAGGIAGGKGLAAMLALGADGVSVGTRFIASTEAKVTSEYKQAIVRSNSADIVYTDKLSGTPCSVISTPDVMKMGLHQNFLEKYLSQHRTFKKYYKMLIQYRGAKMLEKAAKTPTYKDVWCAGQSSALIKDIKSTSQILNDFVAEYEATLQKLPKAV